MATLKNTVINDTGELRLPTGNQGQRTGAAGSIRYNTDSSFIEAFYPPAWRQVATITPPVPPGQSNYFSPGTYTWTAPANVANVWVLAVGGGGGGGDGWANHAGGGGGLGWKNNITVVPGTGYTVVVGNGGGNYANGGTSYFQSPGVVSGWGGGFTSNTGGPNPNSTTGGGHVGDGGGSGGHSNSWAGGGGAGGYTGRGSNHGEYTHSGGGGTGGQNHSSTYGTGAGGGVGLYGQGSSGQGFYTPWSGNNSPGGGGNAGSGGNFGHWGQNPWSGSGHSSNNIQGGAYGGGGGGPGTSWPASSGDGFPGAVRVLWGTTINRSWPSTNVGDL
jgi:hypothetical protein